MDSETAVVPSPPSTSEAAAIHVVEGLLDDLLNSVCSRHEKWDIASLLLSSSSSSSSSSCCSLAVDVCDVVRREMSSSVITGYCAVDTKLELLHVKCVEQHVSGYCGHYAFFFSLCCLEMSRCEQAEDVRALLEQTRSPSAFWRRYWLSIRTLVQRAREEPSADWWPWTEHHVLRGEMERSYLSHLITFDPHVCSFGDPNQIVVLHFAYGCIQNNLDDIIAIQEVISTFSSATHPSPLMFILGVTNHWVATYAYCTVPESDGDSDGDGERCACAGGGEVRVVYFDSNNIDVHGASNDEIKAVVKKKEEERVKKKGKVYSDWKRAIFCQALQDQRDLLSLLCACLSGQADLRSHSLSHSWMSALDSFQEEMAGPALSEEAGSGEGAELFLPLLLHWLESHYRPQSLRDHQVHMLSQLGRSLLSEKATCRLESWLSCCRQGLQGYEGGIPLVDQFISDILDCLPSLLARGSTSH